MADIAELFYLGAKWGFYLILFFWATSIFVFVPEKTFATTLWFGSKFMRVLKPGVNFKLPFPLEQVDVKISTKVQAVEVTVVSMSKDNAKITIKSSVHYTPKDGAFYEAAYSLENPEEQMKTHLDNYLRAKLKEMTVQEIYSSTNEFQDEVMARLSELFSDYGFSIKHVLVGDPVLSGEMITAYERKLISEQENIAAQNEGQALKTRMTMKAEAEGESLKIKALAFKEFRHLIAEGNSEAITTFLKNIEDKSLVAKDVLDFFGALDEREAFRDAAAHGGRSVFIAGGARSGSNSNIASEVAAAIAAYSSVKES
jgi:regulator of protease activity HflC (stomatin/prohibitin superfamily)